MAQAAKQCKFASKQAEHRRGEFPALAVGVSFGGGQKVFCHTLLVLASTDITIGTG